MPDIIIVGFGVAQQSSKGAITRHAVAEYINRWSAYGNVTWLVERTDASDGQVGMIASNITVLFLGGNPLASNISFLRRLKREPKPIVVAAYPTFLRVWPAILRCPQRTKRFAIYVGNDFEAPGLQGESIIGGSKRLMRAAITRVMCRRADVLFARGAALKRRLGALNVSVFETVPLTMGISAAGYERRGNASELSFLYVGKLMPEKGVIELIDGYLRARNSLTTLAPLRIVGNGPLENKVRDFAARESSIIYSGYIDDPTKLAQAYRGAAAVVVPTRASWEGVPRVIDEALSVGVPVWSTPLPAIVEQFGGSISYFRSSPPSAEDIVQFFTRFKLSCPSAISDRDFGAAAAADQHWKLINA